MGLFLQSQSASCNLTCPTPNPPEQTPTAVGTLYLPKLQPANPPYQNPSCNNAPVYQQALPNGGFFYPLDVDAASAIAFWFKIKVSTIDGCYIQNTFVNPNNRTALNGKGVRINYPTNKPYIIEVWAQVCGSCITCWFLPGEYGNPEWYCKFADSDNNYTIFGNNNPYNPTFHQSVKDIANFATTNNGNGNGSIEPKFKYNGNVPFGTNVLP